MVESFKKLGLSAEVVKVIKELGFSEPSQIQKLSIPIILDGKDVVGGSATGSGKTLAFGAGIFHKVIPGCGVQSLVLTPTRELAEQVADSLRQFSKHLNLKVLEVFGGVDIERQIRILKEGVDVVVGTPGRVLDHLERKTLVLDKVKVLVLDEADRMSDMGFMDDVEKIIKSCPSREHRQTLLFSATSSSDTLHIENAYMNSPKLLSVESFVDPTKLKQYFYDSPGHLKFSLLAHLLSNDKVDGLVMVFCNTRSTVDSITRNLEREGIKAIAIHGGLTQNRRSSVIESFTDEQVKILVCTDVAARGLDIPGVMRIINYDIPKIPSEYVHRIGRTARAGMSGEAISIVGDRDYDSFRRVFDNHSDVIKEKKLPFLKVLSPDFSRPQKDGVGRSGSYSGRSSGPRRVSSGYRGGDSPHRSSSGPRKNSGYRGSPSKSSGGRKRSY